MILNDEAHHLHDSDLAWNRAIDSLHKKYRELVRIAEDVVRWAEDILMKTQS